MYASGKPKALSIKLPQCGSVYNKNNKDTELTIYFMMYDGN